MKLSRQKAKEKCYCGKEIDKKYSPCCSLDCWIEKYEVPKKSKIQ